MRLSSEDFHCHEGKLTKEGTKTIRYTDYRNISEDYYRHHFSFTSKNISKTIMVCSRLRNQFLESRSTKDKAAYNKQRSYCLSLVPKTKKDFFSNLHHKKIADRKCFRKYIKLLFPEKSSSFNRIATVKICNIGKG